MINRHMWMRYRAGSFVAHFTHDRAVQARWGAARSRNRASAAYAFHAQQIGYPRFLALECAN